MDKLLSRQSFGQKSNPNSVKASKPGRAERSGKININQKNKPKPHPARGRKMSPDSDQPPDTKN